MEREAELVGWVVAREWRTGWASLSDIENAEKLYRQSSSYEAYLNGYKEGNWCSKFKAYEEMIMKQGGWPKTSYDVIGSSYMLS